MPEVQPVVPGGVSWRTPLSGDRAPTSALTVGMAEILPGDPTRLRLHRHEPPKSYYVLSGEGAVRIEGVDHPVRAGSAVFIPSNAVHAACNTGSTPLRLVYMFPVDAFSDVAYVFEDPAERYEEP